LLSQFSELYPNRHSSILRQAEGGSWRTTSQYHRLSDQEILGCIEPDSKLIRGCRWDESTRFAVLDIDSGSKYYNLESLTKLKSALASVGLTRTRLYRSSESKGWHLYIFFDSWIESERLRRLLKCFLQLVGFHFLGGQLEIFPCGNGLRLPLQRGFAWLNNQTEVIIQRSEISTAAAISLFLRDLAKETNSATVLDELEEHLNAQLRASQSSARQDDTAPIFAQADQTDQATTTAVSVAISQKSSYHGSDGLALIRTHLSALGLQHSKLYETGSERLVTVFFLQPQPAKTIDTLSRAFQSLDLNLDGSNETLVDHGRNFEQLLRPGFAWLNNSAQVIMRFQDIAHGAASAVLRREMQLCANEVNICTTELLDERDVLPTEELDQFDQMVQDASRKIDISRWQRGRDYWRVGLSKQYQRHDGILSVGYYLWFGDYSAGLAPLPGRRAALQRERLITQWLREKHNGFCNHINTGAWHVVHADIHRAVNWSKYESPTERIPYLITEALIDRLMQLKIPFERLKIANDRREEGARHKITAAVNELIYRRERLSIRQIVKMTGCSRNTVRKHKDILLSHGSGDHSSVGGGFQLRVSLFEDANDQVLSFLGSTPEQLAG